jgi:hypothetical protein
MLCSVLSVRVGLPALVFGQRWQPVCVVETTTLALVRQSAATCRLTVVADSVTEQLQGSSISSLHVVWPPTVAELLRYFCAAASWL